MKVSELIDVLDGLNVQLWAEGDQIRYRALRGAMTADLVAELRAHKLSVLEFLRNEYNPEVVSDVAGRFDPFPLTEVQSAYLLGRQESFAYGGVGCSAYGELAFPELDPRRVEAAWRLLIRRHDMLRAVFSPEGYQRVLTEVPEYAMTVGDMRGMPATGVLHELERVRELQSHQVFDPSCWPLFKLQVTQGDSRSWLHFSIDFLIADYVSIHLLLDELMVLYRTPEFSLPPLSITFRDYMAAERRLRAGRRYRRDREYWLARIDHLPAAPELPRYSGANVGSARFRRWEFTLTRDEWLTLRTRAARERLTTSAVILAAYTDVLRFWSRQPEFTLNVTLLRRMPLHSQVSALVGDFTSVCLLAVEHCPESSFVARARALAERLWDNIDHASFSGIEVIRELTRRRGSASALFPVVYTSALGINDDCEPWMADAKVGEFTFGISQTPQVTIDCQVMLRQGVLTLNWDVREGVFPIGVIDDMFSAFHDSIHNLARVDDTWSRVVSVELPSDQLQRRRNVNNTASPKPVRLLHEEVFLLAEQNADRWAVATADSILTYGELRARAEAVAAAIHSAGVAASDLVAISAEGTNRAVAVFGVLLAGTAYLPIDTAQPIARRDRILSESGAKIVLTDASQCTGWPPGVRAIALDDLSSDRSKPSIAKPNDLAYVIYTSGSTGAPKGVMISHRAALNTIDDINQRFDIQQQDRILSVSSPGFDLAVYDLFGPLSRGGCLVLPDASRRNDPSHWADLIERYQVTIWNSVPAALQLLLEYLNQRPDKRLPTLRLGLLSGDWIPLKLPEQVARLLPGMKLVSLGGATEGAIWSVVYPIETIKEDWRSIPYGKPLTNQTMHVLDGELRPRPDWVAGELFIGGAGLALGYLGDSVCTAERFLVHPETGERLYRTGDIGRYMPDGNIEFLGREDSQLKIRGYRVELAEIEEALLAYSGVASGAVVVVGDAPSSQQIAAFVEPIRNTGAPTPERPAWVTTVDRAGKKMLSPDDKSALVYFAKLLDRVALLEMIWAMRRGGLFERQENVHRISEIIDRLRVSPKHHRLIRRWLHALSTHGLLEHNQCEETYRCKKLVEAEDIERAWAKAESAQPQANRRTELMDYFRKTGKHLPELLRSEMDALALLFPEGRVDIHEVAYNDNLLSRYLNHIVTSCVQGIAEDKVGRLRILEVGAGVGGTSVEVISELAGRDVDYLFTDVSPFFLNNAAARFSKYPWVRFAIFNLNEDFHSQGLEPNSFDVIICANVLHYAQDAGEALARLRELLCPSGWLVFIEMVRDNYQVLTSMEFLFDETVNEFQDVRREYNATFLSLRQWHELLAAAGADSRLCWPEEDEELASIGFHVFAAQFKSDFVPLDRAGLTTHLSGRLLEPMRPSVLRVVDSLPRNASGKVDRRTLLAWATRPTIIPACEEAEPPKTDLERRVAAIWSAVLNRPQLGRDQNHFECGGDSLMASQLVGRLRDELPEARRIFFDSLLRIVLEGPTVASVAARLEQPAEFANAYVTCPAASPLIALPGPSGFPQCVLVHDASGTLASYQALLNSALLGSRAGLVVQDAPSYLSIQPAVLIERLAADYARALQQSGPIHLIGHDFGGLLATEVARQLTEMGRASVKLTVISSLPPNFRIDDELLAEFEFVRGAGLDPTRLGYPAGPALGAALRHLLNVSPGRVPEGRLSQLKGSPEIESAAWCFRRLAARSPEERMSAIGRALTLHGSEPVSHTQVTTLFEVFRHGLRASALHDIQPFAGDMTLLVPAEGTPSHPSFCQAMIQYWKEKCLGTVRVAEVPGNSASCLRPPHHQRTAELLNNQTSTI